MRLDKSRVAAVVGTEFGHEMLLAGDRAQAGNPEKEQVWNLLVDEIEPDPDQPRRHFDPVALQELADDIGRRGVLQPLVVAKTLEDPTRYRIIVGERRWRASKLAGKPRVPCLIREMSIGDIRQAQMVENVVREGLNDVERGLALRALYEEVKRTEPRATWEDVARRVGLSRVQIHLLSRLSHLPQSIVDMINNGRLSGSHGVELGRLNGHEDAQQQLAQEASKQGQSTNFTLSVSTLRLRVDAVLQDSHGMAVRRRTPLPPQKIIDRAEELSNNLRPDLPQTVREELRKTAETILKFLEQDAEVLSQLNTKHRKAEQKPANGKTKPEEREAV